MTEKTKQTIIDAISIVNETIDSSLTVDSISFKYFNDIDEGYESLEFSFTTKSLV